MQPRKTLRFPRRHEVFIWQLRAERNTKSPPEYGEYPGTLFRRRSRARSAVWKMVAVTSDRAMSVIGIRADITVRRRYFRF